MQWVCGDPIFRIDLAFKIAFLFLLEISSNDTSTLFTELMEDTDYAVQIYTVLENRVIGVVELTGTTGNVGKNN